MKTLIIAEAGVNHNGDINIAKKLIKEAALAGADLVKFQSFITSKGISKNAPKAKYQKELNPEESQYEMVKKLELSYDQHIELMESCKENNIRFFSTAFDIDSFEMLKKLGLNLIKVPSGEITNLPLLREFAKSNLPLIVSTGMADLGEIEKVISILQNEGTQIKNITLLHCNTEYPTPFEDVNLLAMKSMRIAFGLDVGYSDHTKGIEVPIAAVALGATVIEKHFTLDCNMDGPDHMASIEPKDFKLMVDSIRNIEKSLGSSIKKPSQSEFKNIAIVRKSIVAICKIKKGEIFSSKNIATKRPGTGISPMMWDDVIGKTAKQDFLEDEIISL
tara:strand:- start:6840 stop:7838 length:999 start_codon:yes stop_codon:yes gene_type:complete